MQLAEQQERIRDYQEQKAKTGRIRVQAAPETIKDFVGVVVGALESNGFDVIDVSNEKKTQSDENVRNVYIVAREAGQEGKDADGQD